MSQFDITFGALNPEDVCDAVLEQIPGQLSTVSVLASGVKDLTYRNVDTSAKQATLDILSGIIVSAVFHSSQGGLRYALIMPPLFNGQQLSIWSATLEWNNEEWKSSWKSLLKNTKLAFITVGNEESPEVVDADMSNPKSDVWRSWPAVMSAVRLPSQEWMIVPNPSSEVSIAPE